MKNEEEQKEEGLTYRCTGCEDNRSSACVRDRKKAGVRDELGRQEGLEMWRNWLQADHAW